jgi:hypothetical protein
MAQAPNDATAALLEALTQLTDNLKNKQDNGFSGFKATLKHVPVLADEMEWSEWIIKTKDAIRLMKYGPMLDDENALPDKWDFVKVWLCQGLNRSDSYTVHHSPNLKKALENLRKNHAPEDHNQVIILYKRLYGLKLGPREDPIALINRAQDISTQLKDLKETISEFQVSSAVIAALETSPLYEGTIKALQTIGKEITLNVLLNAFQNVGIPKVAGAFNAEGSQDNIQQPENLMDSIANLTKVANQIKSRVNHKRFAPYDKKNKEGNEGRQDDNHGGRGGHQNTRGGYQSTRGGYQQNRGGYHGNQNPRGRGGTEQPRLPRQGWSCHLLPGTKGEGQQQGMLQLR